MCFLITELKTKHAQVEIENFEDEERFTSNVHPRSKANLSI